MFQRVLLTIGVNEKVSIDTGSHCRSTCTVPEDVCLKEKLTHVLPPFQVTSADQHALVSVDLGHCSQRKLKSRQSVLEAVSDRAKSRCSGDRFSPQELEEGEKMREHC